MVSPVLSNIYLHKLDEFVERELIPQYTRGEHRAPNPELPGGEEPAAKRAAARGPGGSPGPEHASCAHSPQATRWTPATGGSFYCRYADDHLLGFIGPKAEAEQIKAELARFLRETLALELNPDKTLITHARTQPARFLGYDIIVQHCDTKITRGRRSANGKVALRVPPDVVKAQCARYRRTASPGTGPGSRTCPTTTSCGSTEPNTGASSTTSAPRGALLVSPAQRARTGGGCPWA